MQKIDTSQITSGVGMPVKKGTIDLLQQSYNQLFAELAQEIFPNLTLEDFPAALRGATWTLDSGTGTYTLQPGAIFIPGSILGLPNGELFILPEVQTTTPTGGELPILTLSVDTTTWSSPDGNPVVYTDNNPYYPLTVRTLTLTSGNNSTPGFVCNLLPNDAPGLLFPSPLSTINLKVNYPYTPAVNVDSTTTRTIVFPATSPPPSTTQSSAHMTVAFNCNLQNDAGVSAVYVALRQISGSTDTIIRDVNLGVPGGNIQFNTLLYLSRMISYSPGDTFYVEADIAYNSGSTSGFANFSQMYLTCESNDAIPAS